MATTARSHVRDLGLAPEGARRIDWADRRMPVLRAVRDRFARDRPLAGVRVSACLHVTAETAALVRTLQAGGADVVLCGSGPASTQDDVAAALVAGHGVPVFALRGEDDDTRYAHLEAACDHRPQLVMDGGAELISILHSARRELLSNVVAGTEETATGVLRLRALERDGKLAFPVVAVNEAQAKHLFADRHGSGQSAVEAVVRATGLLVAGSSWVVAGYGAVGRGVAARARGLGAVVAVAEIDPLRALEAVLDGFRVLPLDDALPGADVVVTATGEARVVGAAQLRLLRDGCVLANAGHSNVEIDLAALRAAAGGPDGLRGVRPHVDEAVLPGGRSVFLLAGGRPVNLAAGEGHPAALMDLSFASQALAAEHAVRSAPVLERRVYQVPEGIDREIARVKLATMGVAIDGAGA